MVMLGEPVLAPADVSEVGAGRRFGDEVLAQAEGLPTERLEEELRTVAAQVSAATCRFLLLVAEYDARKGWESWGVASCAQWLMWRCGVAAPTAREHMRVAKRLVELPVVREAFARGELSYSKVRSVIRMASPASEVELVAMARNATASQLGRLAAAYVRVEEAEDDEKDDPAGNRFGIWWRTLEDGTVETTTRMRPEDFAAYLAQIDARTPPPNTTDGTAAQTIAARRLDGLMHTISDAAASPEAAGPADAEIVVHVSAETLAGEPGPPGELEEGPSLPLAVIERLICNGTVRLRGVDADGRPVDLGYRRRGISPGLRRALRARDRTCRFPGCDRTAHLHGHHVTHWPKGPTDLDNLAALCSHHHRLVHDGGYGCTKQPDGTLRFTRPDGHTIEPHPAARATSPDDAAASLTATGIHTDHRTGDTYWDGSHLDQNLAITALWYRNHGFN